MVTLNSKFFQLPSNVNFEFLSNVRYRFDIPRIHGNYVGTGDVFACLLLAWLNDTNNNLQLSITNVLLSLQALLQRTAEKAYGNIFEQLFIYGF
jgi:pyridoxal/pyridoxine/pyridoxamine kinase